MTPEQSQQYQEEQYERALDTLRERGYNVQEQYRDNQGHRYCRINGVGWTDRAVLIEAYGEETANHILSRAWESSPD